jgi:hypothetical protein
VSVVDEAISKLEQEREAIWLDLPDEVAAISRGEIPRGTGSKGQYLATLIFAENELRTLSDEVLWYTWELAAVKGGADLATLQAIITSLVGYKADMFDFVGLPQSAALIQEYVAAVGECQNLDDFSRLTGAALTYVNRLHMWVDLVFPWGVCDGFKRVAPAARASRAVAGEREELVGA